MRQEELEKVIKKHAAKNKKLVWEKSGYVHSPFISKFATINKHEYNTSFYSVYSLISDPNVLYVNVLSYYNDQYILKCGDPYLEGTISPETVSSLVQTSLAKVQNTSSKTLPKLFHQSFKSTPKSKACTFNQKNYEIAGEVEVCSHVANFLNDLPKDVFDTLNTHYHYEVFSPNAQVLSDDLQTKFERYAFKKHLLLEGDKGSGKTYAATMWGKEKNITQVFIGGHEQFESIDFLGHYIQQQNAQLIWKDGPLSEAFRKAQAGEKVILIIDEILRIPKRELNILISALSPIDGKYVLRTGRAMNSKNDVAVEEVIQTHTNNLCIIGTTNIGAGYAVEAMDEALIDRFKPVRKDTTIEELRRILMQTAHKRNISYSCVNKLMDFYSKMNRLYSTKIISKIVNIRHLNEALELAKNKAEIKEILVDSILLWVDRDIDGHPNKEQLNAVESVMRKVYV